jgi:hypothetical protein
MMKKGDDGVKILQKELKITGREGKMKQRER